MSKSKPVTTTQVNNLPAWQETAFQNDISNAGQLPTYQPYSGQGVAPLSDLQTQALGLLPGLLSDGRAVSSDALQGLRGAMVTAAPQVGSGSTVGYTPVGYNPITGAPITAPDAIGAATTPTFSTSDLASSIPGLLNPFTNDVTNTTLAQLERQRIQQQQGNASAAVMAGTFGDDRYGVTEGETNRGFADAAASTLSNLNMNGWTTALQSALQTALANQGAGVATNATNTTREVANQGTTLQSRLANQQNDFNTQATNQNAGIQTGVANQNAGIQTQEANQADARTRDLANMQSLLSMYDLNLNAAEALGGYAPTLQSMDANGINGLLTGGGIQQQTNQGQDTFDYGQYQNTTQNPYQRLQAQISAASGLPSNGSTTTGQVFSNPLAGALGLGLGAAGLFGKSGAFPGAISGLTGGISSGVTGLLGTGGGTAAAAASGAPDIAAILAANPELAAFLI